MSSQHRKVKEKKLMIDKENKKTGEKTHEDKI